jgi:hypothetical protein
MPESLPVDRSVIYALTAAFIFLGVLAVLGQLILAWCFLRLTRIVESIARVAPVMPERPSPHNYVEPTRPWPRPGPKTEPKKVLMEHEPGEHQCSCGGMTDILSSAAHENSTVLRLKCRVCGREFEVVL